jgi:hypothetical protein
MIEFKQADFDRMRHVQGEITKAVFPYRETVEAALVIFALCRCAKILLDLYPPAKRAVLAEVITGFLAGDDRATKPMGLEKFFIES